MVSLWLQYFLVHTIDSEFTVDIIMIMHDFPIVSGSINSYHELHAKTITFLLWIVGTMRAKNITQTPAEIMS